MRAPSFVGCALLAAAVTAPAAKAGFILDDFDDPVETSAPEMEGQFIPTENVGPLGAHREVTITGQSASVVGRLDANVTRPSRLTFDIDSLDLGPDSIGRSGTGVSYTFEDQLADLSKGGLNSGIVLEISEAHGEYLPNKLWSYVVEPDDGILAISPLRLELDDWERGSIFVPFDSFIPRGQVKPDFSDVFSLTLRFINDIPFEDGWFLEIDRVRVGNVPEPVGLNLAVIFSIGVICFRTSDRGRDGCFQPPPAQIRT